MAINISNQIQALTQIQAHRLSVETDVALLKNTESQQLCQDTSGTLAKYMRENGMETMDVNQLYSLANNLGGDVPEDVQKAAAYMLVNIDIYSKVARNNNFSNDGTCYLYNMEQAASGNINISSLPASFDSAFAEKIQVFETLSSYMQLNNIETLDMNQLYSLATNKDGNVPEEVQKAASFMLRNPQEFSFAEKIDGARADGVISRRDLDNVIQAAQMLNKLENNFLSKNFMFASGLNDKLRFASA